MSPYASMLCNPIWYNDPLGDIIRFKRLRVKSFEFKAEGKEWKFKADFEFKGKVSEKRQEKLIAKFQEKSVPIIEAMGKTKLGRQDVLDIQEMPTLVTLKIVNRLGPDKGTMLAQTIGRGKIEDDYYKKAKIPFYKKSIEQKGLYRDFDEAYHALGAHEKVHLEPSQIVLDNMDYNSIKERIIQAESQTTYKHQFKAIQEYWLKYGRGDRAEKIEQKFNDLIEKGIPPWE